MGKVKLIIGIGLVVVALVVIYFVLNNEHTLVTHPKGVIAHQQLELIVTNVILMLLILVPTAIILLLTAWKFRANNRKTEYTPEHRFGKWSETLLWIAPAIIVLVMAPITWYATHKLDPFKPIEEKVDPLIIQVVAIDWKWLFIYPKQEIATLNFVQFPERTPIRFDLAADHSPMNSFWIPELSGQIYCMTGMVTSLHVMADGSGEYVGKAAEINGKGYSSMTFKAKSTSQADFDEWIASVKKSPLQLTEAAYQELLVPSVEEPITFYSNVKKDLFHTIVRKYEP